MIPAAFDYYAPASLADAIGFLSSHQDEAKLLAGGQSLIPLMKLRLASPCYLVDLGRIPGLSYIREDGTPTMERQIAIGALTPYAHLEESDLLRRLCPLLIQTASVVADVQTRNRGTLGGSLANADPSADMPAAVLALEAKIKVAGPEGERWVKAEEFFMGLFTTALSPNEILTEIRIPLLAGFTSAYLKAAPKAGGFAIVGVAVSLKESTDRTCEEIRIGVTGLTERPFRARATEAALRGKVLERSVIDAAAATVTEQVDVFDNVHASSAYRSYLARLYVRRAIQAARRLP